MCHRQPQHIPPFSSVMTRFRAYSSDASSSDEEEEVKLTEKIPQKSTPQKSPRRTPDNVKDEEQSESESSSSSSSSVMDRDELMSSPPRRPKKTKTNALVADENGDFRFAHEVDVRVSPPSSPSGSSPPRTAPINHRGDPTIIPWAQQVGVDAQKMHVMQTALFRMPEEAAALKALNEPTKTLGIKLDKSVNRKHSRDSDGDNLLRLDPREVCLLFDRARTTLISLCVAGFIWPRCGATNVQAHKEVCACGHNVVYCQ